LDVDFTDIGLRVIGAFYAFAGYVATRAGLTSYFIDRAIAAIAAQKPSRLETWQAVWMLGAATLVLAGGLAFMLLLDVAPWLFLASALGQALYIFFVAPRYFDVEDPPDPAGRRASTNAFVLYSAATAFVLWADYMGHLTGWREVPWPLLAAALALVAAHLGYVIWIVARPLGSAPGPSFAAGPDEGFDPELDRARSKRIKVMADYDAHPLWALDEDLYGDFPPEHLELSPQLTRDLNAWADAYQSSLNRDDPGQSRWDAAQHAAHAQEARPLAVRLARERPDLMVYVVEDAVGVVQVHADEAV
jgi:hypothetical protein